MTGADTEKDPGTLVRRGLFEDARPVLDAMDRADRHVLWRRLLGPFVRRLFRQVAGE